MSALREIYERIAPTIKAAPLLLALPVAAEMLQHVVEIRLGMYATGALDPDAERTRLVFGAVKVLAIFLTLLFALRWWRFDGDGRRAVRLNLRTLRGVGIVILVQAGGELLVLGLGAVLGAVVAPGPGARAAFILVPLLLWLFFATLLYPWYVGLLTEDPGMTLRRSFRGVKGRMWRTFGLFVAGFLPAMILHYAFGFAAIGRPEALVWAIMAADAVLVGLLALLIASTYFTIYRRAVTAAPVSGSDRPSP